MKCRTHSKWSLYLCLSFLIFGFYTSSCIEDHEGKKSDHESETFQEVQTGDTIPAFILQLNDGKTINSKKLEGECSVLVFFHTKCKDCQAELPIIQSLYDKHMPQVNIICVSRKEDASSIATYWEKENLTLPFAAQEDGALYYQFAQTRIPRVYVVNKRLQVTSIYTDKKMASLDDLMSDINKIVR